MNQTAPWSEANVRRLRKLAGDGLTLAEIADAFGRHKSTIQRHAQRHDVEIARVVRSTWQDALDGRLRELAGQGYSRREIAQLMDQPLSAVDHRLTSLGIQTRGLNRPRRPVLPGTSGPEVKTSRSGERFAASVLDPLNAPPGARLLPLTDREPGMCCWPFVGPEGGTLYCAADVAGEGNYCAGHAARMFAGGRRRDE
ncbi:MAG: hypothetical protein KDJ19_00605 [Hyphomicrobiaceae bacterium]|nr:hypothetical protein [Hyphomicrobiaceae bacterium]MCC0024607.1 hypothetical protein [Hyphomicrobiaceae bacterium]